MRFRWTSENDTKLRDYYKHGYVVSMIAKNMGTSNSSVRNRIHVLQLKRNLYRRPFTEQELDYIRKGYPNTPTAKMARKLHRTVLAIYRTATKLGIRKSEAYLNGETSGRTRTGTQLGAAHRFPKGHVPANKGLRRPGYSLLHGRMAETTFKKGQLSGEAKRKFCPIGTVKFNADGYLVRKINDKVDNGHGALNKNWEYVHKRTWEDAHGPIPKGYRIWWKDGNHANCALENLELLSDKEHMARTTIHNLPEELKSTILWAGALKRRIGRMQREQREKQTQRPAEPSVRNHRAAKR